MTKEKYVTREYFDRRFDDLKSNMHIMLEMALDGSKTYHKELMERRMGALREGFSDEVRGAMDGIIMLMEKSENHEGRICKIEEGMI